MSPIPPQPDRCLQSRHHSRRTKYYVFMAASASFHSSLTRQSKRRLHGYCLLHGLSTPLHTHIHPCINSTQSGYLPNQPSILPGDKCLSTSLGKFTLSRVRGSKEPSNRGAKAVQSQKIGGQDGPRESPRSEEAGQGPCKGWRHIWCKV